MLGGLWIDINTAVHFLDLFFRQRAKASVEWYLLRTSKAQVVYVIALASWRGVVVRRVATVVG